MADEPQGRSLKELQEENLRVQNEHLREETEFLRGENEEKKAKRVQRQERHEKVEQTLAVGRVQAGRVQRSCTHRKGGKGLDVLQNNAGNDPNYTMADQQQPNGEVWRLCTRCFATWKPGDIGCAECGGRRFQVEDGKRVRCKACKGHSHPSGIGYAEAMKWPTDNTGSSSVLYRGGGTDTTLDEARFA